jgi:SAM-dependent methyltransferase
MDVSHRHSRAARKARTAKSPGRAERTFVDRDHAREAYDAFAAHYDAFTAHHDYARWTATLEGFAREQGLAGRRLLDVACGTGKSFLPFLERGYEVTACDVSPAMLRRAAAKAGDRVRLEAHDARALPRLGEFDLVCCLDDGVNYQLSREELTATLAGLRRNLAPGGVALFDANSLHAYRTFFASTTVMALPDLVLVWEGHATRAFAAGDRADATLEALEHRGDGTWSRRSSIHHQRHHPRAVVQAAMRRAGLRCVAVHGMRLDGQTTDGFHETRNSKAVYIARHRTEPGRSA